MATDTRREQQLGFIPRLSRHVVAWGLCGLVGGLTVGLILGLAFTERGGMRFWMLLVGPAIFFGGVCAFTAGIASLESPPPGNEPSQIDGSLDSNHD